MRSVRESESVPGGSDVFKSSLFGLDAPPYTPSPTGRLRSEMVTLDWDEYHKDLVDVVATFVLIRTYIATRLRQLDMLDAIFNQEIPLSFGISASHLDSLRENLHNVLLDKQQEVLKSSPEYILLGQAISLLEQEVAGMGVKYDPFSAISKVGFFGSAFMDLMHTLSTNRTNVHWSRGEVERLYALGRETLQAVPRLEKRFGVVIPPPSDDFIMSSLLLCGINGCDYHSETFLRLSFLWHWLACDLETLARHMEVPFIFQSLLSSPEGLNTFVTSGKWDVRKQDDEFGHTLWHALVLATIRGGSQPIYYDGQPLLLTLHGHTILHYAAALGTKLEVRLLQGVESNSQPRVGQ